MKTHTAINVKPPVQKTVKYKFPLLYSSLVTSIPTHTKYDTSIMNSTAYQIYFVGFEVFRTSSKYM